MEYAYCNVDSTLSWHVRNYQCLYVTQSTNDKSNIVIHIHCTSNYDILIAVRDQTTIDDASPSVVEGMGLLGKTSEVIDVVIVVTVQIIMVVSG